MQNQKNSTPSDTEWSRRGVPDVCALTFNAVKGNARASYGRVMLMYILYPKTGGLYGMSYLKELPMKIGTFGY